MQNHVCPVIRLHGNRSRVLVVNMTNTLRIGIAGLGNVGVGVLDILKKHESLLANRAGSAIKVTAVSARTKGKNRGHDLSAMQKNCVQQ